MFVKNQSVVLGKGAVFECGYAKGYFPYKLEEITIPTANQILTVRHLIKLEAGYGLRFNEIINPKFPHWIPSLSTPEEDVYMDLEPLFAAIKFDNYDG